MDFKTLVKEKTREELLIENYEIEMRLKKYRKLEIEGQKKLRVALDYLNGIQSSIEIIDNEFDDNCAAIQALNTK